MKRYLAILFVFFSFILPLKAANVLFVADGGYAYGGSAVNNVALPIPNGSIVNGQLMVMTTCLWDTVTHTVTTPSGWTYYNDFSSAAGSFSAFSHCYIFYKYAASEGSTITVTASGTFGANTGIDGNIRVFKNTATSSPISAWATVAVASGTGTGQTVTIPAAGETFKTGEMYMAVEVSVNGVIVSTGNFAPTAGDLYNNTGSMHAYSFGDLNPGSTSSSMVMTICCGTSIPNINDEQGIGIVIAPLAPAGGGGLTTLRAGR